jgi:hypothetical protein
MWSVYFQKCQDGRLAKAFKGSQVVGFWHSPHTQEHVTLKDPVTALAGNICFESVDDRSLTYCKSWAI